MDYLFFSLLMLAAQFSPGPDMLLLIRNALAHPQRAGLWTVVGIAAGLSVHLAVVFTGLALAVKESRVLFPALLLMGGAWLGWLGVGLMRTRPGGGAAEGVEERQPLGDGAAFCQGLFTNLTNAKAVLFLATVVLSWLGPNPGLGRQAAAAGIILGQALLFWSLFVLALQHPGVRRRWHRSARPLHVVFGVGLCLLGLSALGDGIHALMAGAAPSAQGK